MKKKNMKRVLLVAIPAVLIVAALFFVGNGAGPVEVLAVEVKPYAEKIIAVGQLGPAQETTLIAEVSGTVKSLTAEEGGTVSAGELLLEIENPVTTEYSTASTEYSRLGSLVSTSRTDYNNAKPSLRKELFLKLNLPPEKMHWILPFPNKRRLYSKSKSRLKMRTNTSFAFHGIPCS